MTTSQGSEDALYRYVLRMGDNALIIGQRLIEYVTHAPELEEELANANFALDYLGHARLLYSYAGELEGAGRTEDDFAFQRSEREFCNCLLVEQPNGHFGDILARTFLFDEFYALQLDVLTVCRDRRLAEIAVRGLKEIRYHQRHNSQWVMRLGDGTVESHRRLQQSVDDQWRFTGELFTGDEVDRSVYDFYGGPDLEALREQWLAAVTEVTREATIQLPERNDTNNGQTGEQTIIGGRVGQHSEHFGRLIAEMQFMQRSYPGLSW